MNGRRAVTKSLTQEASRNRNDLQFTGENSSKIGVFFTISILSSDHYISKKIIDINSTKCHAGRCREALV